MHGTQIRPRTHRRESWNAHSRQRGHKIPGQKQQQQRQTSPAIQYRVIESYSDDVESERQYLEWLLYEQGLWADDLFSRVVAADVAIDEAYDDPGSRGIDQEHQQRQARKDRARLQRLIAKAFEREKEILSRLGEIQLESQYRERWLMVERQKTFLRQQQQQREWVWGCGQGWAGYYDDHWNEARRQKSGTGADASYYPHYPGPTNTARGSSYTRRQQRQHAFSEDYLPYTAAEPHTWYPGSSASAGQTGVITVVPNE